MKTKNLVQSVLIPAPPRAVYETLMTSKRHAKLVDSDASISRKIGGAVSVWGGMIAGVNLELLKDRRIIQAWRSGDWPEGHYSCATFDLKKAKGGTRLTFTQTGIPAAKFEGIRQGWKDYYWTPLLAMFRAKKD